MTMITAEEMLRCLSPVPPSSTELPVIINQPIPVTHVTQVSNPVPVPASAAVVVSLATLPLRFLPPPDMLVWGSLPEALNPRYRCHVGSHTFLVGEKVFATWDADHGSGNGGDENPWYLAQVVGATDS